MVLSATQESVLKAIKELEIIDAHEHLFPEKNRVAQKVDFFTLFSQYTKVDLLTAGMPLEGLRKLQNRKIPLEERWKTFSPYLKYIRYGSYARPAFIAAKEFYGFDDINKDNYKSISDQIIAGNTPGIYQRILRKKCKIRLSLTMHMFTLMGPQCEYNQDTMRYLRRVTVYAGVRSKKAIERHATDLGEKVETIDDYLEIIRKGLEKWKSDGAIGIKMISKPYETPNRTAATSLFNKLMKDEKMNLPQTTRDLADVNPLFSYLMEEMLDMAAEVGLVVAVHTGVWNDFRVLDPQHMIPVLMRHPRTRFDIFHMGIPYVRETAIMGKNFPNAWLNLCWCHIISPKMICSVMDELIDLVPVNKITAFGGDYMWAVEKVYGHLVMARENIARVLGKRVEDKLLTENEAVEIAKLWFYENPKQLYQLDI